MSSFHARINSFAIDFQSSNDKLHTGLVTPHRTRQPGRKWAEYALTDIPATYQLEGDVFRSIKMLTYNQNNLLPFTGVVMSQRGRLRLCSLTGKGKAVPQNQFLPCLSIIKLLKGWKRIRKHCLWFNPLSSQIFRTETAGTHQRV